jgi:hypothetical protein
MTHFYAFNLSLLNLYSLQNMCLGNKSFTSRVAQDHKENPTVINKEPTFSNQKPRLHTHF